MAVVQKRSDDSKLNDLSVTETEEQRCERKEILQAVRPCSMSEIRRSRKQRFEQLHVETKMSSWEWRVASRVAITLREAKEAGVLPASSLTENGPGNAVSKKRKAGVTPSTRDEHDSKRIKHDNSQTQDRKRKAIDLPKGCDMLASKPQRRGRAEDFM